jgi:MFS family permease
MPEGQVESVAPEATRPTAKAYAVVIVLFLFQTLNFFDKLVFGLSAVPLMKEFSLTPKTFGLLGSSFFLLFPISGILVGLLVIGRVKVKWLLLTLALIWSFAQIFTSFTSSVVVLVGCRILLGLGEGPGLPTALHACYNWFSPERRSIPSAIVLQGISFGLLVGSPLLTYAILHYGWRKAFLGCGLLGIGWLIIWLFIGGEGPYAVANQRKRITADARIPAKSLWLDPTIVGVMIMSTMAYWVTGMSATWLPAYLQLGLGYKPVYAGWIISAVYIFQSPMLLVGGWLNERLLRRGWSRRRCLGVGSGVVLLTSAGSLQLAIFLHGPAQLFFIAIAFAAPSLTTILGPVALGSVAPAAQRGSLIVVIYSANTISALFSIAIVGWIVDMAGKGHAPLGFAHAMSCTAGVLAIGAVSAFALIYPERTIARFMRILGPQQEAATAAIG